MFAHGACFINGASPDGNKIVVIEKDQYKVFKGKGYLRENPKTEGRKPKEFLTRRALRNAE
jgi:hypothetical protein